jgi:hypothetical protein
MRAAILIPFAGLTYLCACGATPEDERISKPDELGDVGVSADELTAGQGIVFNTGGVGLNVRKSPSTTSTVVAFLPEGKTVNISCQTTGTTVGSTNVWNRLDAFGGYVADAFLWTGYNGYIPGVSKCGEASTSTGCGSLTYTGKCDGNLLSWCEGGVKKSVDCAASGRKCGYDSASIGYNCLGSGTTSSSGLLTVKKIVGGASYSVSQPYGPTNFNGGYSYCHSYGNFSGLTHCGVDIAVPYGTKLYVPGKGTVTRAGGTGYFEDAYNKAAGELRIKMSHDGAEVVLGHMSKIALWKGQSVSAGTYAGLSGTMNGPHIHIEVRVPDSSFSSGFRTVDPMKYFGW